LYNGCNGKPFCMSVVKAFLFDLDGTIVDTHRANFLAYEKSIKNITNTTVDDSLSELIRAGESSISFLPKVIPGISDDTMREINSEKQRIYPEHLHESVLNEFLSTFLSQMFQHYTTVLVTTAKKNNALSVLKHHKLEGYFTHMIFGDDVENMKPSPDAYLRALEITGLQKNEVLAFEDSEKGIEAANAAGINVIHVRTFES